MHDEMPEARAAKISERLVTFGEALRGLSLPGLMPDRHIISLALSRASIDDAGAIIELVRAHGDTFAGPAFTLLRPMNEKAKRAAWFAFCATDDDAKRFNDRDEMPRGDLTKAIEAIAPFNQYPVFSKQYANAWEKFHSFTHGGRQLVGAYRMGSAIGAAFPPKDIVSMLDHVEGMAVMSAQLIAMVAGEYEPEQAHRLLGELSAIFMPDAPGPQ